MLMKNYLYVLGKLRYSKFRSSFHLNEKDKDFVREKGLEKVERDAFEILSRRIKTLNKNDGRQTPWKGHPVFVAQHALALCCRKCMEKWYGIERNKELKDTEINGLKEIVVDWIKREVGMFF